MTPIQFAPKWSRVARLSLALATLAAPVCILAQSTNTQKYTVVDLGPVGPSWSQGQPFVVSGSGLVNRRDGSGQPQQPLPKWVSHATVWEGTSTKVITIPGLGGPNNIAFGVNLRGQVAGQADTETADPNGEDFCGSAALGLTHSGNTCEPFLWQNGVMFALPRLRNSAGTEGSNGAALQINDFGMVAGMAENGEVDSTCPGVAVSPQTIEFKPVIWMKPFPWSQARLQELATVAGDPDGIAYAINDLGQAVGASGTCAPFNVLNQNNLTPTHAVLWRDGNAIDLGNLHGDGKFAAARSSTATGSEPLTGRLWELQTPPATQASVLSFGSRATSPISELYPVTHTALPHPSATTAWCWEFQSAPASAPGPRFGATESEPT